MVINDNLELIKLSSEPTGFSLLYAAFTLCNGEKICGFRWCGQMSVVWNHAWLCIPSSSIPNLNTVESAVIFHPFLIKSIPHFLIAVFKFSTVVIVLYPTKIMSFMNHLQFVCLICQIEHYLFTPCIFLYQVTDCQLTSTVNNHCFHYLQVKTRKPWRKRAKQPQNLSKTSAPWPALPRRRKWWRITSPW